MQNTFASPASQSTRSYLWFLIVALLLTIAPGCIVEDDGDPEIISLTITPSQISRSEAGTSNEFFTATIEVANFADDIIDAEVYIVSPSRTAVPGKIDIDRDTIILSEIAKSWFSGLEPGVYTLGASVKSETVADRNNVLTTVTVTD